MDIIIAERSLRCGENKINFTFNVDNDALGFIEVADLFTMFGNALDNAIESVMSLDENKRTISLSVKAHGDFLKICIENYMSGKLVLQGGMPVSSKEKNGYHGFGVKSIKYIVGKYKGNMLINTDNDIFSLNILIPIPEANAA